MHCDQAGLAGKAPVLSGYPIPCHAPASGKIKQYNGLLKTTLKGRGGRNFKHRELHLVKVTWLVNTRGSTNRTGPVESKPPSTTEGAKLLIVHTRNMLGGKAD